MTYLKRKRLYVSDIFAPPRRGGRGPALLGGGHWNTTLPFYLSYEFHRLLDERMHVPVIIDERHHLTILCKDLLDLP